MARSGRLDRVLRDITVALLVDGQTPLRPVTAAELGRSLGLPRSSVYRLLAQGRRHLARLSAGDTPLGGGVEGPEALPAATRHPPPATTAPEVPLGHA
jgi:hypothetical protein